MRVNELSVILDLNVRLPCGAVYIKIGGYLNHLKPTAE